MCYIALHMVTLYMVFKLSPTSDTKLILMAVAGLLVKCIAFSTLASRGILSVRSPCSLKVISVTIC